MARATRTPPTRTCGAYSCSAGRSRGHGLEGDVAAGAERHPRAAAPHRARGSRRVPVAGDLGVEPGHVRRHLRRGATRRPARSGSPPARSRRISAVAGGGVDRPGDRQAPGARCDVTVGDPGLDRAAGVLDADVREGRLDVDLAAHVRGPHSAVCPAWIETSPAMVSAASSRRRTPGPPGSPISRTAQPPVLHVEVRLPRRRRSPPRRRGGTRGQVARRRPPPSTPPCRASTVDRPRDALHPHVVERASAPARSRPPARPPPRARCAPTPWSPAARAARGGSRSPHRRRARRPRGWSRPGGGPRPPRSAARPAPRRPGPSPRWAGRSPCEAGCEQPGPRRGATRTSPKALRTSTSVGASASSGRSAVSSNSKEGP